MMAGRRACAAFFTFFSLPLLPAAALAQGGAGEDPGEPTYGEVDDVEDVVDAVDDGEAEAGAERAAGPRHHETRATIGDPSRVAFSLPGEAALRLVWQSDLELSGVPTDRPDPEENVMADNQLGQNLYLLSWLRLRPELQLLRRFRLIGQVDFLHGQLAGDDTHDVGPARDERSGQEALSVEGIRPRWLYLEWDTGYGILRAGQMGSNWGMGLLANDGDHADSYLFGDHLFGDVVERVVFATKPFYNLFTCPFRELAVAVGGDLVFDDGIADLVEGDMAWQFVFALLLRLDAERAAGIYVAYRNQTYADGDTLEVTAIDAYLQWNLRLAHQVTGYAEAEVVGVVGTSNAAPNLDHLETDVRQLGAAARVGLRVDSIGLDVRVEGGYGSGDADTSDGEINRFTFDADYRVGLILFPELLGWSTARAAALASNPELVGVPQDGVELLPSNGGVSGAAFLYPSVTWSPVEWLDVRFAVLVAQATSDVVSPFETKARGRASSFRGGLASSRDLGLELDLGVFSRFDFGPVVLLAGLEGGYCMPGRAFDDADGNPHPDIGMVRTRLQLDW